MSDPSDTKMASDPAELVREYAERRARQNDDAGKQLNRAVENAFQVWEQDPMGVAFQRSILAQLPYMVDPDAPVLKSPVSLWDVFDSRICCPHPDFYNKQTGVCIDSDVHQGEHFLQSAQEAMRNDWNEEVIVASFIHDFGKLVRRQEHCYLAAEMFKPYVSEKIYWLVLWHFDIVNVMPNDDKRTKESGFVHPGRSVKSMWYNAQAFKNVGGREPGRLNLDLEPVLNHPWYEELAQVRQADDFGRVPHKFPNIRTELEPIVERHVKRLPGGLGNDKSSAERLWRIAIEGVWMT